jgi:hypothetical protein
MRTGALSRDLPILAANRRPLHGDPPIGRARK